MDTLKYVGKTELARNVRSVINNVLRGQTTVVENHGQPEVVIVDVSDYYIMRAFAHYHSGAFSVEAENGLQTEMVSAQSTVQAKYDLVLSYYLVNEISLSRAAELLDMTRFDLQTRFMRLDIPLHMAPADVSEVQSDIAQATAWVDTQ